MELSAFDPWGSYSLNELHGVLTTWQWLRENPRYAPCHEAADRFIRAVEHELLIRGEAPEI